MFSDFLTTIGVEQSHLNTYYLIANSHESVGGQKFNSEKINFKIYPHSMGYKNICVLVI